MPEIASLAFDSSPSLRRLPDKTLELQSLCLKRNPYNSKGLELSPTIPTSPQAKRAKSPSTHNLLLQIANSAREKPKPLDPLSLKPKPL